MNENKKAKINVFVSAFSQFVIIFLGMIVPRVVLVNYGSDTNGLTSTISQIFTYMALLEAGISQAARNALYKPIQEKDKSGISYYMSAARYYYRRISIVYLAIVIVMALGLPFIIKTEVPFGEIFLYILFEGLTSVVSFFFLNVWICYLGAAGKNYIVNGINVVSKLFIYAIKISLAMLNVSIVYIQVGYFVVSLIQLAIYYYYMKRNYDWIDYKSAPSSVKLPDRNAYIISEISWTIFSSTDMIVLSAFVSTSLSSVYSVYNMVFLAINNMMSAVFHSLSYKLGQTYVTDIERYKRLHNLYNSIFVGLITLLMSVTYMLIIPFVKIYTRGVSDINYVYPLLPLLFCCVQILSWSRIVAGHLVGVAGHVKKTAIVSIIEALANVLCSIVFVNIWGITGVLLATTISLPLKFVCENWLVEKVILNRSPWKTILIYITNYFTFACVVIISRFVTLNISSYFGFALWGGVLSLCMFIIVGIVNYFANRDIIKMRKLFN